MPTPIWRPLQSIPTLSLIHISNAPGGGTHLIQIALFGDAGLNAQALTSDGSNKDILAVMSGDAICTAATISLAATYVESGDLIPIAVFSDEPYTGFEGYDEVPTVPSLGYDITDVYKRQMPASDTRSSSVGPGGSSEKSCRREVRRKSAAQVPSKGRAITRPTAFSPVSISRAMRQYSYRVSTGTTSSWAAT